MPTDRQDRMPSKSGQFNHHQFLSDYALGSKKYFRSLSYFVVLNQPIKETARTSIASIAHVITCICKQATAISEAICCDQSENSNLLRAILQVLWQLIMKHVCPLVSILSTSTFECDIRVRTWYHMSGWTFERRLINRVSIHYYHWLVYNDFYWPTPTQRKSCIVKPYQK